MFIGNFLNFWTKYLYLCFSVKSHCYDNPCKNSGTCRDHLGNYSCECPPGFMGENCQGKIMVNLLFLIYLTWCQLILFRWQLEEIQTLLMCRDIYFSLVIDHCYDEPCKNNGSCVNTGNAYKCTCPAAFTGLNCEGKYLNLIYKHQWNTTWAFARKLDIFTCENNMLSSLLVLKKYFTSERSEQVKYFSTLEEKFGISARPCNILYVYIHLFD